MDKNYYHDYYLKHKEEILAKNAKYIKEHPEKHKLYRRNNYYKYGGKERQAALASERRAYFARYKHKRGCVVCGETDSVVLDFHHVDPSGKLYSIASMKGSLQKMKIEAAKCVVLCANDHRRIEAGTINLSDYVGDKHEN